MNKKILLFTEFSKKKGLGHFYRSKILYEYLKKKKLDLSFFINKNNKILLNKIKKCKDNIIIIDYKFYSKKLLKFNKKNKIIIFDSNIKNKNLISLNPLKIDKNKYSGPKWFAFDKTFFKIKKNFNKKKLNLFICQGGTDANSSLKKIIQSLASINPNLISKCIIKVPKKNFLNQNNYEFNIVQKKNLGNLSKFFSKIDIAICGCGNFSYELGFFGIPSVFSSYEKREVELGKKFEKKGLGRFYLPNEYLKISEEINKLLINKSYFKKIYKKKRIFFYKDGLSNIYRLLKKNNEF